MYKNRIVFITLISYFKSLVFMIAAQNRNGSHTVVNPLKATRCPSIQPKNQKKIYSL